MLDKFNKPQIIFILLSAFFLSFPWLGREFYTRGEPREALIPQAMLSEGDWVLPRTYDNIVPAKPPLLHWGIAIASLPFGDVSEITSRVPSALVFVILSVYLLLFSKKHLGDESGLLIAIIFLTSFEWVKGAVTCRVDTVFTAALSGGLLKLFEWHRNGSKGIPYFVILLFGLATLAKGPVSVVLPGIIWVTFYLFQRKGIVETFAKAILVFLPAGLFPLIWYGLAYYTGGKDFFEMVWYENAARFMSTTHDDPHKHSAFYIYGTVILGLMPWTILLFFSKDRVRSIKSYWAENEVFKYAVIVSISFLIFFSIPVSKRSVYLLPAYPFFAIILSFLFERSKSIIFIKRLSEIAVLLAVFIYLALIILTHLLNFGPFTPDYYFVSKSILANPLSIIIVAITILLYLFARRRGAIWQISTYLSLLVFIQGPVTSSYASILSEKKLATEISQFIGKDQKLYSFNNEFYGTSFYLKKQMFRLESIEGVEKQLSAVSQQKLITEVGDRIQRADINFKVLLFEDFLDELKKIATVSNVIYVSSFTVIKKGRKVVLVDVILDS